MAASAGAWFKTSSNLREATLLEIATHKVAQVILFAHEIDRAEGELTAFIEGLNADEKVGLVAIMWIGRGSFEVEELDEAIAVARQESTSPTADYLIGTPHLADHLEAGMDALGLDVSKAEEDLL